MMRMPRVGAQWVLWVVAVRFVIAWIAGVLMLAATPEIQWAAIRATVGMMVLSLRFLGATFAADADTVRLGAGSLRIASECTPVESILLLAAAMLAVRASHRARLTGMLVGAVVLTTVGLLRMLALLWIAANLPGAFDTIHVYVWQTMSFAVLSGFFLLWMRRQPVPLNLS